MPHSYQSINTARHQTIVDIVQRHAYDQPNKSAFVFLDEHGTEVEQLSFAQLDIRARAVAAKLQLNCSPGDRVLLMYDPGLEFVVGFLGCLYAGAIAVPVHTPSNRESRRMRMEGVLDDCGARLALTTQEIQPRLDEFWRTRETGLQLQVLMSDIVEDELASDWRAPYIQLHDTAFLQYTSGSSDAPAGVCITHAALLANQLAIKNGFRHDEETVFVGWTPLFHDMGLVGNVIQPLYLGIRSVLLSPYTFLRYPIRWLQAITRYRATTSGGPNFAYELCARDIADHEKAQLDLSSWIVAFNGAEPIFADTLQRFSDAFTDCGFSRRAFLPCYGMAEATLLITCGSSSQPYVTTTINRNELEHSRVSEVASDAQNVVTLVSSGVAQTGMRIAIVDPESGEMLPERQVGEIWVTGTSVATSYWRETTRTSRFGGRLKNDPSTNWLQTGDVGFLLNENLFVTGRRSDLIIVRGRNVHPQDLERTVELSHPALLPHGNAAFSVLFENEEQIVVVQEVRRTAIRGFNATEVAAAVRAAVATQHALSIHELLFVRPGAVSKTSSGKVNRIATRRHYVERRLKGLYEATGASLEKGVLPDRTTLPDSMPDSRVEDICSAIRAVASRVLRQSVPFASNYRSLVSLGVDSLATVRIQRDLENLLGKKIPLELLLSDTRIIEIAAEIGKIGDGPRDAILAIANRSEGPASEYQHALWLKQRLEPTSNALNVAFGARIPLSLPRETAEAAVRLLLDRHPGLLTAFALDPSDPETLRQRYVPADPLPVSRICARQWPQSRLCECVADAIGHTFDLEAGRTFHFWLFELDGEETLIVLVAHHLVMDAWSLPLIVDDFGGILRALILGTELREAPQRPNSIDLAFWQRALLAGPRAQELRKYWQKVLTNASQPMELPADVQLPGFQANSINPIEFHIPLALVKKVDELARSTACTAGTIYLSALQCLLYRYTGVADSMIMLPAAVRPNGAQTLIGYAVNLLPIRVIVEGDSSFAEMLRKVRIALLGALDHSEMPLSLIARDWRREHTPDRFSFGNVMFVWHGDSHFPLSSNLLSPGSRFVFADVEATVERLPPVRSQEGIVLSLTPDRTGAIFGQICFDPELFSGERIKRLANHYLTLLEDAVSQPERRVRELDLLTPQEFQTCLIEWNRTPPTDAASRLVFARIEEQIRRTPTHTAVTCGSMSVSYAELAEKVANLSRDLKANGVERGDVIGVSLPRSSDLVVALLAIWNVGATYLPLDPALPIQRLRDYVADASCSLVIGNMGSHDGSDWQNELRFGVPVVQPRFSQQSNDPEKFEGAKEDDVAYILFTSGSTGRPKGVQIEQRALSALFEWVTMHYEPEELRAVLAATSICFDISLFELLAPLLVGGTVVVADSIFDASSLNYGITLINTVPSVAAALLAEGGIPATVCTLNLAGERLSQALVEDLYARTFVRKVYDLYGPTEDTVFSTCALRTVGGFDNIGRPIAGSQAYVVDDNLEPVPVGNKGELLLGGPKLALGYVGRPDWTDTAFLTDTPLSDVVLRVYRTGDIVRQLPDGRLQYVGRGDRQFKIRGSRVELGEIEERLSQIVDVREAAVVLQDDVRNLKRLSAFVVLKDGASMDTGQLRQELARHLPDYMIPVSFVVLAEFPRNINGKLDRLRLSTFSSPITSRAVVEPRSTTECRLYQLWKTKFSDHTFGVDDTFFELGGDSLMALQLHASICHEFHIDIPPASLITLPTIASFAAYLDVVIAEAPTAHTEFVL